MKLRTILTPVLLAMFTAAAYGGYTQPAPVTIEIDVDGSGIAFGDMVTARDSDNAFEFIGCGQRAFDDGAGGAFQTGFCQAGLVESGGVTCFTQNQALLDGIDSVADASFITFSWTDDGTGNLTCTRIGSSTQSFYLRKK